MGTLRTAWRAQVMSIEGGSPHTDSLFLLRLKASDRMTRTGMVQ